MYMYVVNSSFVVHSLVLYCKIWNKDEYKNVKMKLNGVNNFIVQRNYNYKWSKEHIFNLLMKKEVIQTKKEVGPILVNKWVNMF